MFICALNFLVLFIKNESIFLDFYFLQNTFFLLQLALLYNMMTITMNNKTDITFRYIYTISI